MILKEAPKITAMLVSLIAGKAAIITALSLAFGMSFANSQLSGLLLAQGGITVCSTLCAVCCGGSALCSVQCDLAVSVVYDSSVLNLRRKCRRHTSPMISFVIYDCICFDASNTVSDHCIIH
jgi:hypothetical protein